MFNQDNNIYSGTVPLFNNLKFNYMINIPIINHKKINRKSTYTLIDSDQFKPLEVEQSFKYKLEESIKKYINDNISKLPTLTDEYCDILGFDYKAIPDRIMDIKLIDSIQILSMSIITLNEKPVLKLEINVMYLKLNNEITQLLPKLYKPIIYEIEVEKTID